MEEAGLAGCPPPPVTMIYGPEGLFTIRLALYPPLSPPTPQVVHISRAVEAMDGSGERYETNKTERDDGRGK